VLQRPWWTAEQMQERKVAQLRAYGMPEWIVRRMQRLNDR
jgi:hypothetical protein